MEKSRKGGVITREAKYLLGEEAAFEFVVETLLSLSFGCATILQDTLLFLCMCHVCTFLVCTIELYRCSDNIS